MKEFTFSGVLMLQKMNTFKMNVFFCDFAKIYQITYFTEQVLVTAFKGDLP